MASPWISGPWRAVLVLGVTQIIAWGTIFYSPVLLAPLIAAEHGWSLSFAMSGFSLGLLIAGLVSPTVGRSIDSRGGHVVMAAGALVSAAGLLGLALTHSAPVYLAAWIVLGAGLGVGQDAEELRGLPRPVRDPVDGDLALGAVVRDARDDRLFHREVLHRAGHDRAGEL